ncbi:MAG: FKBP-type peptidyl-prolyl cis-trans isomerase N-terminal domain-containing protein [Nitrospirae bacterium]|nr:FKBP-type peptidyl-prolyl cis-trans isomerase N-terminal domain-containing protein [Nitrospirota bacterium]
MKSRLIIIVCLVLVSSMAFAAEKKAEKKQEAKTHVLKTEKDKVSYAIGMDMGKFLKKENDVDPNVTL